VEFFRFANGLEIPKVFFGTYRIKDNNPVEDVLQDAYSCGYRGFDCASYYQNEDLIGKALEKLDIAKDVLVTTKIWNDVQGYHNTLLSFEESERRLGKIDILMLHWPAAEFIERWKALEDIYIAGRVRAIGVSNFKRHHLQTLMKKANIAPMIDQIEAHAYFMDWDTICFCKEQGIVLQAWRPLMRTGKMLENPEIALIGRKYGKTAAQICLRFLIQSDLGVVPKSVHIERMQENIDVFDFSLFEEDMRFMRSLDTGVRTAGDPDTFLLS